MPPSHRKPAANAMIALALLAAATGASPAQTPPRDTGNLVRFASRNGDFAIENIRDELFEGDPATGRFTFEFAGSPLRGRSNNQNLSFTARQAQGEARTTRAPGQTSGRADSIFLAQADLSGAVVLVQNPGTPTSRTLRTERLAFQEAPDRQSASISLPAPFRLESGPQKDTLRAAAGTLTLAGPPTQDRRLTQAVLRGGVSANITTNNAQGSTRTSLETARLTLAQTGQTTRFTLPNRFTFSQSTSQKSPRENLRRTITIRAASGTIVIPDIEKTNPPGSRPITSADIKGRVFLTLDSVTTTPDGDQPLKITAEGDSLVFTPEGELRLFGSVIVTSDDFAYTRRGTSQILFILLDQDMRILRYGSRGEPTRTEIRPKPPQSDSPSKKPIQNQASFTRGEKT